MPTRRGSRSRSECPTIRIANAAAIKDVSCRGVQLNAPFLLHYGQRVAVARLVSLEVGRLRDNPTLRRKTKRAAQPYNEPQVTSRGIRHRRAVPSRNVVAQFIGRFLPDKSGNYEMSHCDSYNMSLRVRQRRTKQSHRTPSYQRVRGDCFVTTFLAMTKGSFWGTPPNPLSEGLRPPELPVGKRPDSNELHTTLLRYSTAIFILPQEVFGLYHNN
jgi:hypothetical protein